MGWLPMPLLNKTNGSDVLWQVFSDKPVFLERLMSFPIFNSRFACLPIELLRRGNCTQHRGTWDREHGKSKHRCQTGNQFRTICGKSVLKVGMLKYYLQKDNKQKKTCFLQKTPKKTHYVWFKWAPCIAMKRHHDGPMNSINMCLLEPSEFFRRDSSKVRYGLT